VLLESVRGVVKALKVLVMACGYGGHRRAFSCHENDNIGCYRTNIGCETAVEAV
jgi:hypothetical protein